MAQTSITVRRDSGHIAPYRFLSMLAGTTAGMLRSLSPIFAIHLGATPAQIGVISSFESLGMATMTLPAGMLVARIGPRNVYVSWQRHHRSSLLHDRGHRVMARAGRFPLSWRSVHAFKNRPVVWFYRASLMLIVAGFVPKSRVSSLQLLSSFGGAFVGALLGGSLTKLIGLHGMFVSGAGIYALLSLRWCFGPAVAEQTAEFAHGSRHE